MNSSRSPHGERGLKWYVLKKQFGSDGVAPHTGSVD